MNILPSSSTRSGIFRNTGSLATKYTLGRDNPIFTKYANITYYGINISWQIGANNRTLSFGEINNIHDGLHIRLASALLSFSVTYLPYETNTRRKRIALALQFDDYSDNLLESPLYDYVYVYQSNSMAMAMPMAMGV